MAGFYKGLIVILSNFDLNYLTKLMKKIISIYCLLFILNIFGFAQPWERNSFPGKGHYDSGYATGMGWDHVEATQDLEVSPLDPDFMAYIDNEWSAVICRDGQNFKPLHMSQIGSGGCKIEDIEFSRYDSSTAYVILAHEYWNSLSGDLSPAGIWRSTDYGENWEQIYHLPEGAYERYGNYAEGTHFLEDPSPEKSNHLYFGTSSHGIVCSSDDGNSWENLVPELSRHCIKMLEAGADSNGETILYAIAEKKMPVHETGNSVPFNNWVPTRFTEQWEFNATLSGSNQYSLLGTVGWTESAASKSYAAVFDGENNSLAIEGLNYSGYYEKLTVSAWVKTTSAEEQVLVSFDEDAFWELGIRQDDGNGGHIGWTIIDRNGVKNQLVSVSEINDGDWHNVIASWDKGVIRIFIDGEEEAYLQSETSQYGSATTRYGYLGIGSKSESQGDEVITGSGYFKGCLDDVRIYNDYGFNLGHARGMYLETNKKFPVCQGSLWRILINREGVVTETQRLHGNAEDFVSVEVNPLDPSGGYVIRKGYPKGWPYGGREVWRFSQKGNLLSPSNIEEGDSDGIYRIMINPADTNHVFLRCGGSYKSGFRYSSDGGESWEGIKRLESNGYIPSIQSWSPRNYHLYGLGLPANKGSQPRGTQTAFIPGSPDKILFVSASHGLFLSQDYGATFSGFGGGGSNKDLGQIAVARGNPDCRGTCSFEYGFVYTRNGGNYWEGHTHINDPVLVSLSELSESEGNNWTFSRTGSGIAYHPYNSDKIIASYTKEGYIIRSSDAGKTWEYTGVKNSSLESGCVFWSAVDPNRVYAGDKKSLDGGITWTDAGKHIIAVSDANPDLIVGVEKCQRNISADDLLMYISVDGGEKWVSLPSPDPERVPGTMLRWQVVATVRTFGLLAMDLVAIDPSPQFDPAVNPENLPRILLAGRSGIYEYIASGQDGSGSSANWKIRNTGLEPNSHYSLIEPVPWMGFVIFDPRPGYENIVYAAKTNDIQTLDDWSGEQNRNHACPGGDNFEPFYISKDGGISWEKLHGDDYPQAPESAMIHSVEVDSYGRFYAASCEGIYHIAVRDLATDTSENRFNVRIEVKDKISGEPVSGCTLQLDSSILETDESGTGMFENLKKGVFHLRIEAEGYESVMEEKFELVNQMNFVFALNPKTSDLTLKVLDYSTREPIQRAIVQYDENINITDSEGVLHIGEVKSSYWSYSIEHSSYFGVSDSIYIDSDTILTIYMENILADIVFEIEDINGPLSGVEVNLNEYSLSTDSSGKLLVPSQPARKEYIYKIEKENYQVITDTLFLEVDTLIHVVMDPLSSIGLKSSEKMKIYPNPAHSTLCIYSEFPEAVLKIVDLNGRLIKAEDIFYGINELDITFLSPGIYILKTSSGSFLSTERLLLR